MLLSQSYIIIRTTILITVVKRKHINARTDYIKVCPRDHENLPECIKNSITELMPKLKVGIPELNIPPLEPLDLGRISFISGSSAANLATNLTDVTVWGVSNFHVVYLSVKNTKKGKTFRFKVEIPQIYAEGHYEINTKLLFIDLKGEGKFKTNVSDYHFDCTLKGNVINDDDGLNHLLFDKLGCKLNIGEKKILLEKLFADNPVLEAATKGIIDDNTEALFHEIRPGLQDAVSEKFTSIANQITKAFTYEELFP
ncbi:hypothetical protein RI129_004357 [Pyrocoelia pectoralis]|uniref:Uncharacterized protein n=1 Tax=Pyrocoelia pectoralis TaxID=417401 RepID=A0AAN7ZQ07_9COLE